jgi:hypothetical protein
MPMNQKQKHSEMAKLELKRKYMHVYGMIIMLLESLSLEVLQSVLDETKPRQHEHLISLIRSSVQLPQPCSFY